MTTSSIELSSVIFNPILYQGLWYEVAHLGNLKWQDQCVKSTTYYRWNGQQKKLYVTNTCYLKDGQSFSRSGEATIPNPSDPNQLLLKFTDGLPSDSGLGSYIVHWTDYDEYSIVGTENKQYLWILSRHSQISHNDIDFLLNIVAAAGYNPNHVMTNPKLVY